MDLSIYYLNKSIKYIIYIDYELNSITELNKTGRLFNLWLKKTTEHFIKLSYVHGIGLNNFCK